MDATATGTAPRSYGAAAPDVGFELPFGPTVVNQYAAAEGRLLIKKCPSCGQVHHYPRSICPFCFSDWTEWLQASGRGPSIPTASCGGCPSPTPSRT